MLDGACRIETMIEWAVENSAPAVALTDHGNMFGAWELYSKATKAGVNPIVGCEVYVAPGNRKKRGKEQGSPYHLTLLAEDATGYQNLLKLVSLGYTEGFYSRPRIDMEIPARVPRRNYRTHRVYPRTSATTHLLKSPRRRHPTLQNADGDNGGAEPIR